MTTQPLFPDSLFAEAGVRWFSERGCVVDQGDHTEVFIGGTLIGAYEPSERFLRNLLMVQLSEDPEIQKGKLAAAFEVSAARLRQLRKIAREQGKEALPARGPGGQGRPAKVTPALRRRLYRLFDQGVSIQEANRRIDEVGYGTIWRVHQKWTALHQGAARKNEPSSITSEIY